MAFAMGSKRAQIWPKSRGPDLRQKWELGQTEGMYGGLLGQTNLLDSTTGLERELFVCMLPCALKSDSMQEKTNKRGKSKSYGNARRELLTYGKKFASDCELREKM